MLLKLEGLAKNIYEQEVERGQETNAEMPLLCCIINLRHSRLRWVLAVEFKDFVDEALSPRTKVVPCF